MHYDAWFLRRLPSGAPVWLCCQRDVSEFMGWDKAYEPFFPGKALPGRDDRYIPWVGTGAYNPRWGGAAFRILRGPDKGVFTAALTHSFRLRGTWSPKDLREVMSKVQVDWNWVKLPDGRVFDKDRLSLTSNPGPVKGARLSR